MTVSETDVPAAPERQPAPRRLALAAGAAGLLAALAFANHLLARRAERRNPPRGRFVDVNGVRLHLVERGPDGAEPLVLLHGNGSMVEDWESSGLLDRAAERFRVLAFDRPGFGHSARPRGRPWTAERQADLLREALRRIGAERAVVLGHSWGASVAVALALRHPGAVKALVLASGYYYPTVRADVAVLSAPAVPVVGDVVRHTVSPLLGRLAWPLLMRKIFGPAPEPDRFRQRFPREMALRPSQIRASAVETALLIPEAFALRKRYRDLAVPVAIVAGEGDRVVTTERQSARLHAELAGSSLHAVAGAGHMVHQTAPERVMAAIEEVSARAEAA